MLSVNATLDFMRANGLDKLVDAYAVHVYPWGNGPGQAEAATGRQSRLAKYVLAECPPAGTAEGSPAGSQNWDLETRTRPAQSMKPIRCPSLRGQDKILYALLDGSGLRIGEAFALQVEDVCDTVIHVKRSAWEGDLGTPKTTAGKREVDIHSSLGSALRDLTSARVRAGWYFHLLAALPNVNRICGGDPFTQYS
jgi:integrase